MEPPEMALQLADLPPGYIIRERADVAYADVSPLARDQGWKRGYFAAFYRMNLNTYDITAITQQSSIFPPDRMQVMFDETKYDIVSRANASVSVTEMPFPITGDRSIAYRIIDFNDPYGITTYAVIFTKKDVIEQIEMTGTTTDYEVLKDLTWKAAEKIVQE